MSPSSDRIDHSSPWSQLVTPIRTHCEPPSHSGSVPCYERPKTTPNRLWQICKGAAACKTGSTNSNIRHQLWNESIPFHLDGDFHYQPLFWCRMINAVRNPTTQIGTIDVHVNNLESPPVSGRSPDPLQEPILLRRFYPTNALTIWQNRILHIPKVSRWMLQTDWLLVNIRNPSRVKPQ